LIHLLNNLLAVIQTQVDVARVTAAEGASEDALRVIELASGKASRALAELRAKA